MATVPKYTNVSQISQLPGVQVAPVGGPASYGSAPSQALGGIGGVVEQAGQELNQQQVENQVKLNQISVSNAISTSQNNLIPLHTDIMNRKGITALGTEATKDQPATPSSSQDFAQKANDIFKNTADSLNNPVQKQKYDEWTKSIYPGMYSSVLEHEKQQLQVAHSMANESQLNANSDSFVSNILLGNQQQANQDLLHGIALSNSIGATNGLPIDTIKENNNKYIYGSISKGVDTFIANQQPEKAKELVDYYGDKLPESQRALNMAKIQPALLKNDTFNFVNTLKADPSVYNSDGTLNEDKMLQSATNKYLNATKTVTKAGTTGGYETFKTALLDQESGGQYTTSINKFGAAGAYQMVPGTWQSGLKVLGLPADTPQTQENQDKVANALLKPLYDKYGAKGAAVAWYSGEQNAPRVLAGQNPIGDNGNEYSADAKQDDGYGNMTAPSVNEYAQSILNKMGTTSSTTETVPAQDLVGFQMAKQQIAQAVAESNVKHKQNVDNSMYAFDNWLATDKPSDIATIEAKAQEMGFQGSDLMGAISKGRQAVGLMRLEQNEQTNKAFEEALGKMYNGQITTKGELDTQYGGAIPYSKLMTLGTALSKDTKWATPENMMAFQGVIKDKGITSGEEKAAIFDKINQQVSNAQKKGIPVTSQDITDWATEQTQKVIIGRSWYGKQNKVDTSFVPAGWNITADGVYDTNGVKVSRYDDKTHKFYTNVNGVDIEMNP